MAVPTITAIDPPTGNTKGGYLIRIDGTNFRLPPPPPPTGYLGGPAQKTVSVQFDGVESEWAHAIYDTGILARVPEYRGPDGATWPVQYDVRVANLDDSGVEIPGENVTLVDGFAVDRPVMTAQPYQQRLVEELIKLMRRHVMSNVHLTVTRDYADDPPSDEHLWAEMPVIHLAGPRTVLNRFYSCNREEVEEDPSDPELYFRRKFPVTVDMEFDIIGWAKNSRHLFAMGQAIVLLFRDIIHITIDVDPSDPARGQVSYELDMPFGNQPDYNTAPALDDLRNFRTMCRIRGVHIDDESGTIVERGRELTVNGGNPVVNTQSGP